MANLDSQHEQGPVDDDFWANRPATAADAVVEGGEPGPPRRRRRSWLLAGAGVLVAIVGLVGLRAAGIGGSSTATSVMPPHPALANPLARQARWPR